MLKYLAVLCVLTFSGMALLADEKEKPKEEELPEAIKHLEPKLKALLKESCPEAKLEIGKKGLSIKYRVRKYMVHHRDWFGEWAEEATEQLGPDYKGFYLWMVWNRGKYQAQLRQPTGVQEPYWYTSTNAVETGDSKDNEGHIFYSLSSGSQMDGELLKKIRKCIEGEK